MKTLSLKTLLHDLRQTVPVFVAAAALTCVLVLQPSKVFANIDLQTELNQVESGTLIFTPQTAGGSYVAQQALSTDVQIGVSGLLARAQVRQTFRNNNDYWIEAVYAFPLPDEARVDRMEMHIGERIVKGVIREKAQAKKEYTQALSEGKQASLLESHRANLFTNKVANIPPQETIEVSFSYQWQIDYDDGVFSLRVPLTITPRYLPGARLLAARHATETANDESPHDGLSAASPYTASGQTIAVDPLRVPDAAEISPAVTASQQATPASIFVTIDTALPLESVRSESHQIHTDQTDTQWRVSLASAMVPKDRDFTLQWSPRLGHSPLAAAFTQTLPQDNTPAIPEHFTSVMVIPPQNLFESSSLAREVIFVVDTSGSMQGNSIRQARSALQYAIQRLDVTDTFNVIEFNSHARSLFNNARSATDAARTKAIKWVRSLRADGGTEIALALDASLGNQTHSDNASARLRQVVFVTDGSVGNEAELFRQIENTLGDSRLFTIGIGSAPNTWFMRRAAETGRGTYTYIAKESQVQEKMAQLLQKLERPVLTGITLQWDGIEKPEVYPAVIPDLYAGEPILFDARWQGDSTTGTLLVQGQHAGNKWSNKLQIDSQASNDNSSTAQAVSLEKQWAHRKIEALENSLLFSNDHQAVEQRITDLALHYSMVTRYTSLIAVDQQVVRPPTEHTLTRTAVPSAMPHGNTMLLPQGSLGIGLRLLLAALFSLAAILFGLATLRQVQTV